MAGAPACGGVLLPLAAAQHARQRTERCCERSGCAWLRTLLRCCGSEGSLNSAAAGVGCLIVWKILEITNASKSSVAQPTMQQSVHCIAASCFTRCSIRSPLLGASVQSCAAILSGLRERDTPVAVSGWRGRKGRKRDEEGGRRVITGNQAETAVVKTKGRVPKGTCLAIRKHQCRFTSSP